MKRRPIFRPSENAYRDLWLLIISVVVALAVKAALDRVNDVETSRFNSIVASCEESNTNNRATVRRLNAAIAHEPRGRKRREDEANAPATVLLINALQPYRSDCHAYARERVSRSGGGVRKHIGHLAPSEGTPTTPKAKKTGSIPSAILRAAGPITAHGAARHSTNSARAPPQSPPTATTAPSPTIPTQPPAPSPSTGPTTSSTSTQTPPPLTVPTLPVLPPCVPAIGVTTNCTP